MSSLTPWLHCHKNIPGARVRLFCFPSSGGAAQSFRTWQAVFGTGVEVCPIQPPGRWTRLREPLIRGMEPFVAAAGAALVPLLTRPFALFGHSVGAAVAFELTHWLRRHGHPMPEHLFVASRHAPGLPGPSPKLHKLPDRAFIDQMQARYNGIPRAILEDRDMLALMLPIVRADLELAETYEYQSEEPLDVPVHVYGGDSDQAAPLADLQAWEPLSARPITLRMFPGGHFFLTDHQAALIADIKDKLQTR